MSFANQLKEPTVVTHLIVSVLGLDFVFLEVNFAFRIFNAIRLWNFIEFIRWNVIEIRLWNVIKIIERHLELCFGLIKPKLFPTDVLFCLWPDARLDWCYVMIRDKYLIELLNFTHQVFKLLGHFIVAFRQPETDQVLVRFMSL